jgi:hypothetical protein
MQKSLLDLRVLRQAVVFNKKVPAASHELTKVQSDERRYEC